MAYTFGQTPLPGNSSANTTNLGYQLPGASQNGVMWDSNWQNYNPTGTANGGQAAFGQNPALQSQLQGLFGGQQSGGVGSFQPNGSASGAGTAGAYSIQQLIQKQMDANDQARAQSQQVWNQGSAGVNAVPGAYNALQSTQDAQSLTHNLAQNPLSLSPEVVQMMKNEASNQISSQTNNQNRQDSGTLAAGGHDDSGSILADRQANQRAGMAAQQTQNTNIDIDAAKQRTQDLTNAANVSGAQSARDIGVQQNAANSIISNLPQYKPDDYSGILALSMQQSNQDFQNRLLQSQLQNTAANSGVSPRSPMAGNPIGGQYSPGAQSGGLAFQPQNYQQQAPQGQGMNYSQSGWGSSYNGQNGQNSGVGTSDDDGNFSIMPPNRSYNTPFGNY